jgi:hypothetical protein
MTLRFTVQGDTEAETTAGLQLLLDAGLEVARRPVDTIGNGWMARAIPATSKAPPNSAGPSRERAGRPSADAPVD